MGILYLVRHGQASFGAADYDQLSPLGARQCERLGAWFAARGLRFDAVLRGSLRRHAQSLEGIVRGLGDAAAPEAGVWPGLNEYDGEAVIRAVHAGPLPAPTTPEAYRDHFRLLRQGLAAWMQGSTAPEGMPTYAEFATGIRQALDHVRTQCSGNVLLVSSGGPITTAVGQVLGTPAETTIELNLRLRNSALTEFAFTPKRHMLQSYNHLPHLDGLPADDWVTYS
jgi:broad specificity phosphatase PhoE